MVRAFPGDYTELSAPHMSISEPMKLLEYFRMERHTCMDLQECCTRWHLSFFNQISCYFI